MDAHDLARSRRRARARAVRGRGAHQPSRRARSGHRLLPVGVERRARVWRGPVARGWRSVGIAASRRPVARRKWSNEMTEQQIADRPLPYLINDADEHSTPSNSAYERYIDPDKRDVAIRFV